MIKQHQNFNLFDKLIFEKVVLEPPFMANTQMPNEACFIYAVRGNARVYSPTEQVNLTTKEGVVLKCGNFLNEWLKSDEKEEVEAIAIHFYPEVLKKIYDKELPEFIGKARSSPAACIEKVKADELLGNYINSLQFYFENPSLVSDELLKLKLKELILLLAKTDNAMAIQQLISSLFTPSEHTFKEIIEANIYSNLSNEDLALLTNLSLSSFKREFEKVYRTSPARYIKRRKLKRSTELLTHTNQRIGEVAFACGLSEISHFSKSFIKEYGISPSEYRLNQTN